ncbi:MAG: hypothetical protein E7514_06280 [Ruminococcaceae bacterium]|nr:hypothetical protein [Oscillospiraceae bacterium]
MEKKTFTSLREQYRNFYYHGFRLEKSDSRIDIEFDFEIEGLTHFRPSTYIDISNLELANPFDSETAKKIIFNLGMVELISYWKCACPETVNVECGYLCERNVNWWKKLYFGGLSEFFYINSIKTDEDSFMKIVSNEELHSHLHPEKYNSRELNLIPVGGGKDSCVTAALLKDFAGKNRFFTVNDQPARTDTVLAAGYGKDDIVKVYRTIDKNLLSLNSEGFLNGHTPFSAIVAFLSLYCAYLIGADNIILSNESSANESNIEGENINHQYSKSFEFENDFGVYIRRNIFDGIEYFSILRPFSELQIAKMFSRLPEFHDSFRSCNRGSKTNVWCGKCAKCLFVFTILAPFCDYGRLCEIFSNDMLDDPDMQADFDGLAGFTELKPFECVGTKAEFAYAVNEICERFKSEGRELPLLCKRFDKKYDKNKIDKNLLKEYNALNNVPEDFVFAVMEMYKNVAEDN